MHKDPVGQNNDNIPGFVDCDPVLATHRTYLYWPYGPKSVDEMGFRLPYPFETLEEKYEKSDKMRKVFCFGGSTTFGWYCDQFGTVPYFIEENTEETAVFNLGLGGNCLADNLYVFIDALRRGFQPDHIIFLDGVNEKQGWIQCYDGYTKYKPWASQYQRFDTFYNTWKKRWSLNLLKAFLSDRTKESNISNEKLLEFSEHQANTYLQAKNTIEKIGNALDIKSHFFLQPNMWDYCDENDELRHLYIKHMYKKICMDDTSVIDLSERVNLNEEHFTDWQHPVSDGNRLIASEILKFLS